jgi:hypothetical protein
VLIIVIVNYYNSRFAFREIRTFLLLSVRVEHCCYRNGSGFGNIPVRVALNCAPFINKRVVRRVFFLGRSSVASHMLLTISLMHLMIICTISVNFSKSVECRLMANEKLRPYNTIYRIIRSGGWALPLHVLIGFGKFLAFSTISGISIESFLIALMCRLNSCSWASAAGII